jgi:hypothetical protein
MGLGLAAAHAWILMDLALYGAIRLDHPIRGWRPDRSSVFIARELAPPAPLSGPPFVVRWWP